MSEPRHFTAADTKYATGAWWALVYADGAPDPYWRGPRFTPLGARLAAWRMARKLNRLDAKGRLLR